MTIEELLQLKKPELQKLADDKGIEYNSKTTNAELAEMIHAKDQNESRAQAVADALKESDTDLLGDGDFAIVEGQMVKVITRKDGEVIEDEMSLDELMANEFGTHLALELELAVNEKDAALAKVTQLEQENSALKAKNTQIELRDVATGLDLASDVVGGFTHDHPSSQKPVWNSEAETMKVRVRIMPNKGITSRIRSGMQFGTQYSEHEIDETTFNALIADSHLQVEALDE